MLQREGVGEGIDTVRTAADDGDIIAWQVADDHPERVVAVCSVGAAADDAEREGHFLQITAHIEDVGGLGDVANAIRKIRTVAREDADGKRIKRVCEFCEVVLAHLRRDLGAAFGGNPCGLEITPRLPYVLHIFS